MPINQNGLKIKFVYEKETKNTVRYSEVATNYMRTIYIQKETFSDNKPPKRMTITLTFDD